ncbi:hypothetical protein [Aridibaculum aurantiacum]|uniref:hypothetical protein n=1 Tax=Aridibaculum aurantiacum TaxID=2810307 RepID=UPI001A96F256|nr:hypothetical protein [Aridibaculum aurantiacum]
MKIFLVLSASIFFFLVSSAQTDDKKLGALFDNTSNTKDYAIIFNNSKNEKSFIWSNLLIKAFEARGTSRHISIQKIKQKLLNNDTFNIPYSDDIPFAKINRSKLEVINQYKNLDSFFEVYFNKDQLKADYSEYFKEVAYFLWQKGVHVHVGFNCGSLPCIGTPVKYGNKVIEDDTLQSGVKQVDKYFCFDDYKLYLEAERPDTSILKLRANRTDVQSLTHNHYSGEFHFAKFTVDSKLNKIIVELYDSSKKLQQRKKYIYSNNFQLKEEQYYHSLTSDIETVRRMVVIPYPCD